MDRAGDIRLDPDVVEDGTKGRMPLSNLYELPVFAADTEQKARERHTEKKEELEQIRQNIFAADGQAGKEKLEWIRSQVFLIPPIQKPCEAAQWSGACETVRTMSNTGAARVQGAWMLMEMMTAGTMALLLIYRRKRKKMGLKEKARAGKKTYLKGVRQGKEPDE